MVRVKSHGGVTNRWIVDDGFEANGRVAESIKTSSCSLRAESRGPWIIIYNCHLSFVGNHAIINPNPEVEDGA